MRRIDHIVIPVRDLDRAAKVYRKLGLQVGARNRHPWETENRLIQFDFTVIWDLIEEWRYCVRTYAQSGSHQASRTRSFSRRTDDIGRGLPPGRRFGDTLSGRRLNLFEKLRGVLAVVFLEQEIGFIGIGRMVGIGKNRHGALVGLRDSVPGFPADLHKDTDAIISRLISPKFGNRNHEHPLRALTRGRKETLNQLRLIAFGLP